MLCKLFTLYSIDWLPFSTFYCCFYLRTFSLQVLFYSIFWIRKKMISQKYIKSIVYSIILECLFWSNKQHSPSPHSYFLNKMILHHHTPLHQFHNFTKYLQPNMSASRWQTLAAANMIATWNFTRRDWVNIVGPVLWLVPGS